MDGVLNIGVRPTFDGTTVQVESHFFDFDETIYGKSVEIFLIEKIRSERKFPNPESPDSTNTTRYQRSKEDSHRD